MEVSRNNSAIVDVLQIMQVYGSLSGVKPRLLGLTPPLFSSGCNSRKLDWELRRLEEALHSSVETASEIVSLLRLLCNPFLIL